MLMNSNNMLCWKTIGICNRVSSLCEYAKLNISNGQKLKATKVLNLHFWSKNIFMKKTIGVLKKSMKNLVFGKFGQI